MEANRWNYQLDESQNLIKKLWLLTFKECLSFFETKTLNILPMSVSKK